MSLKTLLAVAVLGAAAPAAFAGDACRYDVYTPPAVLREIGEALPELRVSQLAPMYSSAAGIAPGRTALVREGGVIGQVSFSEDARRGYSTLTIYDGFGKALLQVNEHTYVCPPQEPRGLCRDVTMWTELQPPTEHDQPFLLHIGPDGGYPRYYRYGQAVDLYSWRMEFVDSIGWLNAVLGTTTNVQFPRAASTEAKVFWALASDPFVAPYLPRLTISEGRQYVVVKGVVPSNDVWNRVIDRAREAGYYNLDPEMIIDTRTAIPMSWEPRIGYCPM